MELGRAFLKMARWSDVTSPVIVIGMHRSGTSVLLSLLAELGLFIGRDLDENSESRLFQEINEWLMRQCGGQWDAPAPLDLLMSVDEVLPAVDEYVDYRLNGLPSARFMGIGRYLRGDRVKAMTVPWGWKDPRNTFTLPFWLRHFPQAKVIHIRRHGADVAGSLLQRSARSAAAAVERYRRYKVLSVIRPKRYGFVESLRCATVDGAFSLWLEYLEQATKVLMDVESSRVMDVRYEDVLSSPIENLRKLAAFTGLEPRDGDIERAARRLDRTRAFAYLRDTRLANLSQRCQIDLRRHGYAP